MTTLDLDTHNEIDGRLLEAKRLLKAAVILIEDLGADVDLPKGLVWAAIDKIAAAEELFSPTKPEAVA